MNLYEGNIGEMFGQDGYYGGSGYGMALRNYFTGWNPNYNVAGESVWIKRLGYFYSIIGNVLSSQQANPQRYNGCDANAVWQLGWPNIGNCSTDPFDSVTVPGGYPDAKVASTMSRWGNYDYFNDAVQYQSSEIGSGVTVPGSNTIIKSYVYSATPAWWPAGVPWPPVGPDVTGGNADASGHVNKTPAQLCWEQENLVSGAAFNAQTCFPNDY
jgi:hypothetical protein